MILLNTELLRISFATAFLLWHVKGLELRYFVAEGDTAELHCPERTQSDQILTTWLSSNFHFPISDGQRLNRDFTNKLKFEIVGNFSALEYNLKIHNIKGSDIGTYTCVIIFAGNPLQYSIKLILKRPPTNLSIRGTRDGNRIYVTEGGKLDLICDVVSGIPDETLEWVHNHTVKAMGGPGTLTFELTPRRQDHLENYSCVVNSSALTKPINKTVRLYVSYKPYVSVGGQENKNISEGNNLSLFCNQNSNPPAKAVTWLLDNNATDVHQAVSDGNILHMNVVTRRDSGKYICVVTNAVGNGSDYVTINVQYPADVYIEYRNYTQDDEVRKLICRADGNPSKYLFYNWEQKSVFGKHIRYLEGDSDGTLNIPNTLSVDERYQDSGYYKCSVSNGINNVKGQLNQSATAYLNVQGKPDFLTTVPLQYYGIVNEANTIEQNIYSDPKFSQLMLKDQTGDIVNTEMVKDLSLHENEVIVMGTCHGQITSFYGYRIAIHFPRLAYDQVQNYTITAINRFGDASQNISFLLARLPDMPELMSITQYTGDIFVTWKRKFSGGLKQTFFIEYSVEGVAFWSNVESLNTSNATELSWKISALQLERFYLFRMYSRNKLGDSNRTDVLRIMLKGSTRSGTTLIMAVVGGNAILLLIILGVVFLWRLYKCKKVGIVNTTNTSTESPNIYDEIIDDQSTSWLPSGHQDDQDQEQSQQCVFSEQPDQDINKCRLTLSDTDSNSTSDSEKYDYVDNICDKDDYLKPYVSLSADRHLKSRVNYHYTTMQSKTLNVGSKKQKPRSPCIVKNSAVSEV